MQIDLEVVVSVFSVRVKGGVMEILYTTLTPKPIITVLRFPTYNISTSLPIASFIPRRRCILAILHNI